MKMKMKEEAEEEEEGVGERKTPPIHCSFGAADTKFLISSLA